MRAVGDFPGGGGLYIEFPLVLRCVGGTGRLFRRLGIED